MHWQMYTCVHARVCVCTRACAALYTCTTYNCIHFWKNTRNATDMKCADKCMRAYMRACVRAALLTNKRRGVVGELLTPWGRTVGGQPSPSVVVYLLCRYVLCACMRVYSVRLVLAGARVTSLSRSAVWRASPSVVVYWSSWWVLLGSQCARQRMSGGCNTMGSAVCCVVRNLAKCTYGYIIQCFLFLWQPLPCLHSSHTPLHPISPTCVLENHPTSKV